MTSEVKQIAEKFGILDRMPVGACILRSDFTVIFWNSCLEDWTRISRAKILGQNIATYFPHLTQPKYSSRLEPIFQGGPPTIFSAQLHKHVIPALLPDGQLRIQHATVTPIPSPDSCSEGGGFCALLAVQDVTDLTNRLQDYRLMRDRALEQIEERKRTEEALHKKTAEFEAIFQSIPDAVFFTNSRGEIILTNPSFTTMFGYCQEEMVGKTPPSLHANPDDWEGRRKSRFSSDRDHYLETLPDSSLEPYEVNYRRKNGSVFVSETIGTLVKDGEGKALGFLAIVRDITVRKQAEAAVQRANEQLKNWVNELEARNREIAQLGEMSNLLQACLNVKEAYTVIAQSVKSLFPNVSGGVFAIGGSGKLVEAVTTWGETVSSEKVFAPHECWALRLGRSHLAEGERPSLLCKHLHARPAEYCCIPMMAQGAALGLLYLSAQESGQLTRSKQQLAATVAEHIGLALANLKLRETLQQQSIRDPLTGLFNRVYLEESLDREIYRARKRQQPLGAIVLDIDHFEKFNDTFGRDAGDEVLRELGLFLRQHVRGADIACRYGGDEFVAILPETSLEETVQRSLLLLEGVKHLDIQYRRQSLGGIAVSAGVAIFPDSGLTGSSVIRAAEAAVYRAKTQGRDRVVTAPAADAATP